MSKVQEASRILREGFALSKWPHLHKTYVVTVWRVLSRTVYGKSTNHCFFLFQFLFKLVWVIRIVIRYFQFTLPKNCVKLPYGLQRVYYYHSFAEAVCVISNYMAVLMGITLIIRVCTISKMSIYEFIWYKRKKF